MSYDEGLAVLRTFSEGIAEDDDLKSWVDRCLAFMKTLPPK